MNIESQVCTFEQAKRLKELGVAYPKGQESFFKWFECDAGDSWVPGLFRPDSGEYDYMLISDIGGGYSDDIETSGNWNAFTVAELGVMLDYCSVTRSDMPGHKGEFCFPGGPIKGECIYFPTEAQARAARLIIALEKGWTTSEQVNERLKAA